jgi:UDP-glucose 4-epimerase
MGRAVAAATDLRVISLRYFNVAGAASDALGDPGVFNLIPLALQALTSGRAPKIFGDDYPTPDGTCIRDYVHVEDLARAHLLALDAAKAPGHAVYNLGNGDGYSVREVVEAAERVTGRPIPARVVARRPGDPARLVASSDRIGRELGWRPRHGLDQIVLDAWRFHAAIGT